MGGPKVNSWVNPLVAIKGLELVTIGKETKGRVNQATLLGDSLDFILTSTSKDLLNSS